MIGREKAYKIMEDAMACSNADFTELLMMGHEHFLTRYANSQIHQNTLEEDSRLFIKVIKDKKIGITRLNNFHPKKIAKAVENALTAASKQHEIQDLTDIPGRADYEEVDIYCHRTADISAEEKALILQDMIGRAHGDRMSLSGAFYTGRNEIALLNSKGAKAYITGTKANITVVASGKDTNGYSAASSRDVDKIDHIKLVEESMEAAKKYPETIDIKPGEYPVILDEYCVSEMLLYLAGMGFTDQAAEDGHSFAERHRGEQLFPDHISIYDDSMCPETFMIPFDYEGVPKKRLDFVKNGNVTGNLSCNYYSAVRNKKAPTGHGLPPGNGISDSEPFHLFMDSGRDSFEDLLKKMNKGIYVKKFHYLTTVHPLKTILSGMTRHGVFWVENGEITARVSNMRFTQSIIEALKNTAAVSNSRKLIWFRDFSVDFPITTVVPKLFINGFNFTGNTEF